MRKRPAVASRAVAVGVIHQKVHRRRTLGCRAKPGESGRSRRWLGAMLLGWTQKRSYDYGRGIAIVRRPREIGRQGAMAVTRGCARGCSCRRASGTGGPGHRQPWKNGAESDSPIGVGVCSPSAPDWFHYQVHTADVFDDDRVSFSQATLVKSPPYLALPGNLA
jgi:hypothetical protein